MTAFSASFAGAFRVAARTVPAPARAATSATALEDQIRCIALLLFGYGLSVYAT
jgi:hypothetical protein